MATKITQIASLDVFGASSNDGFLETHAHARRRSKTAFLVFNTDDYVRGSFPFPGLHYTVAALQGDTASNSDSNLSYRGDALTPGSIAINTGSATDAMRKNARVWCMVGPPGSAAAKEVVQKFIYRGGGAIIVSSVLSWPDWIDTFGGFPAIEPYYYPPLDPPNSPFYTGWSSTVPGTGGDNVIENGLYGRAEFTTGGYGDPPYANNRPIRPLGIDNGPLPVFSVDEGSLRVSVVDARSEKKTTGLYSTFTYGAGRVVVSPVPIDQLNNSLILQHPPASVDPVGILARNMVAWVNKQI